MPNSLSAEIRKNLQWQEEGWGRMKAHAQVGDHIWETAIWFDTKHDTYILPVKADVRKKLRLEAEQEMELVVWI